MVPSILHEAPQFPSKAQIWSKINKKVQKPVAFFAVFIYYVESLHKGGDGFVRSNKEHPNPG